MRSLYKMNESELYIQYGKYYKEYWILRKLIFLMSDKADAIDYFRGRDKYLPPKTILDITMDDKYILDEILSIRREIRKMRNEAYKWEY